MLFHSFKKSDRSCYFLGTLIIKDTLCTNVQISVFPSTAAVWLTSRPDFFLQVCVGVLVARISLMRILQHSA